MQLNNWNLAVAQIKAGKNSRMSKFNGPPADEDSENKLEIHLLLAKMHLIKNLTSQFQFLVSEECIKKLESHNKKWAQDLVVKNCQVFKSNNKPFMICRWECKIYWAMDMNYCRPMRHYFQLMGMFKNIGAI